MISYFNLLLGSPGVSLATVYYLLAPKVSTRQSFFKLWRLSQSLKLSYCTLSLQARSLIQIPGSHAAALSRHLQKQDYHFSNYKLAPDEIATVPKETLCRDIFSQLFCSCVAIGICVQKFFLCIVTNAIALLSPGTLLSWICVHFSVISSFLRAFYPATIICWLVGDASVIAALRWVSWKFLFIAGITCCDSFQSIAPNAAVQVTFLCQAMLVLIMAVRIYCCFHTLAAENATFRLRLGDGA